jgi:hypothetical protein
MEFLSTESPGLPVLGSLPLDLGVLDADRLGKAVYDHVPALKKAAEQIGKKLLEPYPEQFLEE